MRGLSLACLTCLLAVALLPSAAPDVVSSDEQLLREHKVPTDGPRLLEYVRGRFTSVVSEERLRELIELLGDESFEYRQSASQALVLVGARARKALQAALAHPDLEVRSRAARCLREIQSDSLSTQILGAAVRLLGKRGPPGAAALLLNQLPSLEDEPLFKPVAHEVKEALADLAIRDGKPEPAMVAALTDRIAGKRGAAGLALARAGIFDQVPGVRALLQDADADIRLSVALALCRHKHKDAVPVLISALDAPNPPARFGAAEETLFRLAGEKSPSLDDGSLASRQRYRKAWEQWWDENKATADLAVLEASERLLGRTMVVLLDANQVLSLDGDKKVRWKIDNVAMPLDVQPLANDRVILAEHNGNRVTERDSKGEVLWERQVTAPLTAQRLANGNTFIANKDRLIEVDRAGKTVFSYFPPGGAQIMRSRKLPGGDILLITQLGVTHFHRLDRFGRPIKSFPVEVDTSGGRLDVTATGSVLIPEMGNNRVCEYDPDGRLVREVRVAQPIACVALPNGHVLVTLMNENRAVELNRAGKEVWEYRRETRVTRAVRY